MLADLKAQGDPRMFGKGEQFDKYPYYGKKTVKYKNTVYTNTPQKKGN